MIDQILLGAGFGLLSTPLLVGMQATVTWHDRGVVTGANVFSRYLGESLGAAICGAMFNSALRSELAAAPPSLRSRLPHDVNAVIGALEGHEAHRASVVIALLTLLLVLLTPRRFPLVSEVAEGMAKERGPDRPTS